jgi:translation initiation factor RLI1
VVCGGYVDVRLHNTIAGKPQNLGISLSKRRDVQGQPAKKATAHSPQSLLTGMNSFLENLDITFRRDPTNYRPRINKLESVKDREQKLAGTFYYLDEDD